MAEVFPGAVYILCFLTSAACAWLLGRSYRTAQAPLLLWSSICFLFLALNNLLLVLDLLLLPSLDLRLLRLLLALAAGCALLFGFVLRIEED